MTFRWYGEGNDSITPGMIKQITGVIGLVCALYDKQVKNLRDNNFTYSGHGRLNMTGTFDALIGV